MNNPESSRAFAAAEAAKEVPVQIPEDDVVELEPEQQQGPVREWVDELTSSVEENRQGEDYIELPEKDLKIVELKTVDQQGPVREWVDELTNQVEAAKNADPKIEVKLVDADEDTEDIAA